MSECALDRCQAAIGYRFKNPELLSAALRHASVASNRLHSNERLEFLGDSILGMVVCWYLYDHYPEYLEGELTKIKSAVVSRKTCAEVSDALGLPDWLSLGKGIAARSRLPQSLSAAAIESLIAALALDAGIEWTRDFILRLFAPHIQEAAASEHQSNFKSQLQQHAQRIYGTTPQYELLDEKGPDHSKCFEVAVCIGEHKFAGAWGPSKKEAEQKAALHALVQLGVMPSDETAEAVPGEVATDAERAVSRVVAE